MTHQPQDCQHVLFALVLTHPQKYSRSEVSTSLTRFSLPAKCPGWCRQAVGWFSDGLYCLRHSRQVRVA